MFSPLAELRYVGNYGDAFTAALGTHSSTLDVLKLRTGYLENNFLLLIALTTGFFLLGLVSLLYWRQNRLKSSQSLEFFRSKGFLLIFNLFLVPLSLGYFAYTFISFYFSVLRINAYNRRAD
jgi:hypothetical protein